MTRRKKFLRQSARDVIVLLKFYVYSSVNNIQNNELTEYNTYVLIISYLYI